MTKMMSRLTAAFFVIACGCAVSFASGYTANHGLCSASTSDTNIVAKDCGGVPLLAGSNLSDVADVPTALANLGIGSMGLQNANLVAITGGTITGITDLAVGDGGTGTGTAFTKGSIVFAGTSGVYAQDNAALNWDDTNTVLVVNKNTDTLSASAPGTTSARFIGGDGNANRVFIETYGGSPLFAGHAADGLGSAPSGRVSGEALVGLVAYPYKSSAFSSGTTGSLLLYSDTTQSDTNVSNHWEAQCAATLTVAACADFYPTFSKFPGVALSGGSLTIGASGLLISTTVPTIASGFGTSPSIVTGSGSAAIEVTVGSGGTASSGVITLPTAAHGWNCQATDITTNSTSVFATKQTGSSATSCTLTNYSDVAVASAWTAADKIRVTAMAY